MYNQLIVVSIHKIHVYNKLIKSRTKKKSVGETVGKETKKKKKLN
jgi:hypothetical protein